MWTEMYEPTHHMNVSYGTSNVYRQNRHLVKRDDEEQRANEKWTITMFEMGQ